MIPEIPTVHHQIPLFNLKDRPVYLQYSHNNLNFALANHQIEIVEVTKYRSSCINTQHTKRVNMVRRQDNALISCSNDRTVKLWDTRASQDRPTLNIRRNQEIYSVFMQKDLLAVGCHGQIFFWDLRADKEQRVFEESFNGDVTDLYLKDNKFIGCSTDGMVAGFDLSIKDEEEATEWTYILGHAAGSLTQTNQFSVLNTTDNMVFVLEEEMMIKKADPNTQDEPRHLLWSRYNEGIQFYVFNTNNQEVQQWIDGQILMISHSISDIDFLEEVGQRLLGVGSDGKIFDIKMKALKSLPKHAPYILEAQQQLVKPKYGKVLGNRKFQPM